jgi:hypothetical protein
LVPLGLGALTARVSSDGRFVTFMSDRSLTGYDNRDVVTGRPDQEVFLYDNQSRRVVCVSCDPTGARPAGIEFAKLQEGITGLRNNGLWSGGEGIAGSVPGWSSFASTLARYQSRFLGDSGRVFFDSAVGLVPQDVNGNVDVYEWEPVGVGDCTEATTGYRAATGGCLGLVSSGVAAGESAFVDASVNGDDVFFLTGERLVGGDVDTALDLYDAHVCSVAVPCFDEPASLPACSTADSCRPAVSGQPSIFGTPASATFSGEGNIPPPRPARGVVLTRAERLKSALKACRIKHNARKRRACEKQARAKYGAKKATTEKATAKRPKAVAAP